MNLLITITFCSQIICIQPQLIILLYGTFEVIDINKSTEIGLNVSLTKINIIISFNPSWPSVLNIGRLTKLLI